MLRRTIVSWLGQRDGPEERDGVAFDRAHVAAAALMVECARVDTEFDEPERRAICEQVRSAFGFDQETCDALLEVAERRTEEVWHRYVFLDAVNRGFDPEQRLEVVAALWEVAYADGNVHPFEEHTIHHVAEELGVTRQQVAELRARAGRGAGEETSG